MKIAKPAKREPKAPRASQASVPPGSYFTALRSSLNLYPPQTPAIRDAQRAALHAVGEHLYSHPYVSGVVVMPTGSGKSAVILASPILAGAKRVLVITPSRLVRQQLAQNFKGMLDPLRLGLIAKDSALPNVREVANRLASAEDWNALTAHDVVVASPPSLTELAHAPRELFDLILVDEAHHVAAPTWSAILAHFAKARSLLFTATPFRRDAAELVGEVIFHYPLARAQDDGVFGKIEFAPVRVAPGQDADHAIAQAAAAKLAEDRAAGRDHRLMVRTDAKRRMPELVAVYASCGLKLGKVDGSMSMRTVQREVARLDAGETDGIVCVNVMGEGFDYPRLKIAALHSPHRSLAATLQFIGRFARTTGSGLGKATFFAVPDAELRIEATRLFRADANWEALVPKLLSERVSAEVERRRALSQFRPVVQAEERKPISLYALSPRFSVQVFRVAQGVDHARLDALGPDRTIETAFRAGEATTVVIYRDRRRVRWLTGSRVRNESLELLVVHYHDQSRTLFVGSSERSDRFAEDVATQVARAPLQRFSRQELLRVLQGVRNPEFMQLGLRSRSTFSKETSYIARMGSDASAGVDANDTMRFGLGHFFSRGEDVDSGEPTTIGASGRGKVWSANQGTLTDLVEWCNKMAKKLRTKKSFRTGTRIDQIPLGETYSKLPLGIYAADWPESVYADLPRARFSGDESAFLLAEARLEVEPTRSRVDRVAFAVVAGSRRVALAFQPFSPGEMFVNAGDTELVLGEDDESIDAYLTRFPPRFFAGDGSIVDGQSLEPAPETLAPFDVGRLVPVDWVAAQVDIEREKRLAAADDRRSLFEWLEERLLASSADVIFCDDGALEMADYVAIEHLADETVVSIYHCKASSQPTPGARLADVHEVAAQALRTVTLLATRNGLFNRFLHRAGRNPSGFRRGDLDEVEGLLGPGRPVHRIVANVHVVQPGISKQRVTERVLQVLAASESHLLRGGIARAVFVHVSD